MNNAGKIVTFIIDKSWRRLSRGPILLLLCSMGYAVLAATFSTAVSSATLAQRVVKLPQWPGVSQLIVYKDRIWFVNSEPFDDTNIADIHSYSVDTGQVRYERSLFYRIRAIQWYTKACCTGPSKILVAARALVSTQ